jgi:hypothetical protein
VFLVAPQSARHWNWEEKGKGKTSSRGMLSASSGSALRPWNLLCLILLHPYATSSYNSGRLPGHRKSTWQSFLKGCLSHPGMLPDRIGSQALRLSGRPDPPSRQPSRQNVSCPWLDPSPLWPAAIPVSIDPGHHHCSLSVAKGAHVGLAGGCSQRRRWRRGRCGRGSTTSWQPPPAYSKQSCSP